MKQLITYMYCAIAMVSYGVASSNVVGESFWPETRSAKELSATLLLSDHPDEVLRGWKTRQAVARVRTTDTIPRGTPIVAFVFFTGCRPDENGLCDASVDFTILRPDGSVYDRFEDRDLWKNKPVPPAGTLRLSAEYVGVVVEPDDPLGKYEFRVSVQDLNAGTTVELKRAFTATER